MTLPVKYEWKYEKGAMFSNTGKNGNFSKKPAVHKKRLTPRVLTQTPKF